MRRTEYILRVECPSEGRDHLETALRDLAIKLGGKLTAIEREQHLDHAIHIGRRKLV